LLLPLLALALLVALAPAADAKRRHHHKHKPKPAATLPLLHAVRGPDARIADASGRQILLRGVNVNQLGDYWQGNKHPPTVPLTRADFREVSRLGWNVVRLVTTWSLWEPEPGKFSDAYLAKVKQAVDWGREFGVYVLIDLHQDAWGKFVAADKTTVCVPPEKPNQGWDGAPRWATITDAQPACHLQAREISHNVAQAFQNFWGDRAGPGGVGIQTRLIADWERIAEAFKGDDQVMGYDLFNEPNPGYAAAGAESATMYPYYDRAIAAIRKHDSRHMVVVEPNPVRDLTPPGAFQTGPISDDPQAVYGPHVYYDLLSPGQTGEHSSEADWSATRDEATAAGGAGGEMPDWVGEFGPQTDPAKDAFNTEQMANADRHLLGWALWIWKQTCGDPHSVYSPINWTSWAYDCEHDRFGPLIPNRVFHYSRPYPQATVGQLRSISFDSKTKDFRMEADAAGAADGRTKVFIPVAGHYGGRLSNLKITSTGVLSKRLRKLPGGNAELLLHPGKGVYFVEVGKK